MDSSDSSVSNACPDEGTYHPGGVHYSSDISRRWEKINADMRQIGVSGVKGTSISAVYANTSAMRSISPDHPLPAVGFSCMTREPTDDEIPRLVDDAIAQVLGPRGLSEIIKRGDRVVIKVNIVGPGQGLPGEKGRGIISDPRVVRYVAGKVREIIGFSGSADLKVIDATFTAEKNPSDKNNPQSFYYARLQRSAGWSVEANDICYDYDADGVLDGGSEAELVNLDSVQMSDRFSTVIDEPIRGRSEVWLPKFLRTKEQAQGEAEYCDVYIGIPVMKSHGLCGMTGALKLHWGSMLGLLEKQEHAGYGFGTGDVRLFLDYLCAMNRARAFDIVIMDALTGNRSGPQNKVADFDAKTDFILVNSILCSKDSVAIDTVETLLGGYNLDSIPLLESAFRDGIGINKPVYIDLKGFDAFTNHKQWLREHYPGCGAGSYPFENGWGNAKTQDDFNAPVDVTVTCERADTGYVFEYTASEPDPCIHRLARIDLLVNGAVVHRIFDNLKGGRATINLEEHRNQKVRCRIAAWDMALNCTLSDEMELMVA
ncbi:MAG TPA: DUF362 domain-containing protein [Methanothrix sp.]|nr:DUF362 domain-containing protein [Methanothrix sp.]HQE87786.1 DUF362 domain-containing protein [Methanothrix sp.]